MRCSAGDGDGLRDHLHDLADRVLLGMAEAYDTLPQSGSPPSAPSSVVLDGARGNGRTMRN
ncbi:MAG: hypothetical protein U0531_08850 [Dehalococcoidia bacterium]